MKRADKMPNLNIRHAALDFFIRKGYNITISNFKHFKRDRGESLGF